MTREPETRHLSADELREVLSQAREEAPTRVHDRRALRADPTQQDGPRQERTATSLDRRELVQAPRAKLVISSVAEPARDDAGSREARGPRAAQKPSSGPSLALSRTFLVRVALGCAVAALAWWIGVPTPHPQQGRAEGAQTSVSESAHPRTPPQPEPPSATGEQSSSRASTNPAAQPVSAQAVAAAVDLLLSGRTRAALDAYRGLARGPAADPVFAHIVVLLERELADCERAGGSTCGS